MLILDDSPRHIRKPGAEFLVMCGCKEEGRTCNMEGGGCECQTSVEGDAFPYAEVCVSKICVQ